MSPLDLESLSETIRFSLAIHSSSYLWPQSIESFLSSRAKCSDLYCLAVLRRYDALTSCTGISIAVLRPVPLRAVLTAILERNRMYQNTLNCEKFVAK